MHKKRVVFFVSDFNAGGVENIQTTIAKNIDRNKFHTIVVTCGPGEVAKRIAKYTDEYHNLGTGTLPLLKKDRNYQHVENYKAWLRLIWWTMRSIWILTLWFQNNKADLIHSHILHYHLIAGVAAILVRIPCVWHIHNPQRRSLRRGGPFLVEGILASMLASKFIAVSQHTCKSFHASWKKKSIVIQNAVDCNEISTKQKPGKLRKLGKIADSEKLVGAVCIIQKRKGLDRFIDTAIILSKIHRNVKFIVVGPANNEAGEGLIQELKEVAELNGIYQLLSFTGELDDACFYIGDMDALFMCSYPGAETFGVVVIEAMAAGVPVVAFENDAMPEIIENGRSGFLVPDGDILMAANTINMILNNEMLAEELCVNAKDRVFKYFNIDAFVASIESIYDQLIQGDHCR
jgi:glycosyltransferase involved in cell wall biosynthesis